MADDEWGNFTNFSGPIWGDDSFGVATDPSAAAASLINPETGLPRDTSWWGQANDWANRQLGPDFSKKLKSGLSGLAGDVKKLSDTPPANPATAATAAILKGATPAGMTRGQTPAWAAILAALQARQQALRTTGLTQQSAPPRGGGLLGM